MGKATRVEARRAEIARRYKPKKRDRQINIAVLRIADLHRLFRARYGAILPDDDAGRADAAIAVNHLAHCGAGKQRQRVASWLELWAPWMPPAETKQLIAAVLAKPRRWRADRLAALLSLTEAERRRLRITTIGAVDMTKAERHTARRERKRIAAAAQRRAQGKRSRKDYEANSITRAQPWTALKVSRSTWYRHAA